MPATSPTTRYRFSGHQTFAFRYGWLEKGVNAVAKDPDVFSAQDAIVTLGVGKNMVESIKHWCLLAQLVEPAEASRTSGGSGFQPTCIGRRLLLSSPWDAFLEDDASLWLVHWLMVTNPTITTTWQLAFGHFNRPDFSKLELVDFVKGCAEKHTLRIKETSLLRDVDCFFRTYLPMRNSARVEVAEETFDCPLQDLGLVQASPGGEFYRFAIGAKPSLPPEIFAYALEEYLSRAKTGRNTLSIQECLYGAESPGQVFRLDENSVVEYVETLEQLTGGSIALDETAGLKQIYRRRKLDPEPLLNRYYRRQNS